MKAENINNEQLLDYAIKARKNSLCTISSYSVGAALLTKNGTIYIGSNIEEKIIPALSTCAERAAIYNAISNGENEFLKIAVVGGMINMKEDKTLIPCAMCLQFILDMAPNVDIVCYIDGKIVQKNVKDFLKVPYINEKI